MLYWHGECKYYCAGPVYSKPVGNLLLHEVSVGIQGVSWQRKMEN